MAEIEARDLRVRIGERVTEDAIENIVETLLLGFIDIPSEAKQKLPTNQFVSFRSALSAIKSLTALPPAVTLTPLFSNTGYQRP